MTKCRVLYKEKIYEVVYIGPVIGKLENRKLRKLNL